MLILALFQIRIFEDTLIEISGIRFYYDEIY
jgi:hypothetical protein